MVASPGTITVLKSRVRAMNTLVAASRLPLDEHLVATAELRHVRRARDAANRLDEPRQPFARHLVAHRQLGRHSRGRRSVARRELEREPVGEADFAHDLERLLEIFVGLARESRRSRRS